MVGRFRVVACARAAVCMAGVLARGVSGAADPQLSLKVGDAAPPFGVMTWLKGEPVERLQPGQVYLVEFWGSRCAPCIAAMPHMSELARQYAGQAIFVGVNQPYDWETVESVSRFVGKQGDRMDFAVAMDFQAQEQRLFARWAKPAGLAGYPAVLIVDRAGRIAWAGSPATHMEDMEQTLEQVVAGTHDLAQGRERHQDRYQVRQAGLAVAQPVLTAWRARNYPAAVAAADRLVAQDPENLQWVYQLKFSAWLKTDERRALTYAQSLPEQYQTALASGLPRQGNLSRPLYEFAVQRLEEKGFDWHMPANKVWELIASAHHRLGDMERAVEAQKNAIRCAGDLGYEKEMAQMRQKLQEYQARRIPVSEPAGAE